MDDVTGLPAFLTCGFGLLVVVVMLVVALAVGVLVCYFLYQAARQIPAEHRKLGPSSVFLLLVPLLNVVWLFIVVIKLSESFQSYFSAQGRTDAGDCGYAIGLGWAIAVVCAVVPVVNVLAGPAALILMILYLVKVTQLKALVTPQIAT
jgi:hypothetical protein